MESSLDNGTGTRRVDGTSNSGVKKNWLELGAGNIQISKTEPSVGTDSVKNAAAGGAPWKVSWAWNWRALELGAAWSWEARRKRKVEMVKAFIVDA